MPNKPLLAEMSDSIRPLFVRVGGREVQVWSRVSPRAQRVKLAVRPGPRVELTVPEGTRREAALAFLQDQLEWLEQALGKARVTQTSILEHLERFPSLTFDDRWLSVELQTGGRSGYKLRTADEALILTYSAGDAEAGALRALRRVAQDGLTSAARRLADRVKVRIGDISIRNQSSRWGSCTADGALSLNWRLVLLPPAMHDHVILHELAHRVHMDHSDRFWAQLQAWDPEWKHHDRELTRRWNILMDLGRK